MLSSGMITHPFFIFPENFTHSHKNSVGIWGLLKQGSEVLGYFEQQATLEQQGKR
jgi:hypothetical protein